MCHLKKTSYNHALHQRQIPRKMKIQISDEGIAITRRFFLAIDVLVGQRRLRGLQTFTRRYNLNYWNVCTLKKEPKHRILKSECLAFIVRDFGISAEWLLTGVGSMFKTHPASSQTEDAIIPKN